MLLSHHHKLIEDSAISPEVAQARGYRTVTTRSDLKRLGFADSQCNVPALLIPVFDAAGEAVLYQSRPDTPRIKDGKPLKYETPAKARMAVDVPPGARGLLEDPSRPLFITEGVRKADAAVSKGLCCIDLLGVWNWRGTNEWGGKTALPDWEHIALNGREVYICFDSDVMLKPAVHGAMARLKAFLESRKASVRLVYLPPGPSAGKTGLDDWLAAGGTVEKLVSFASTELRALPGYGQSECPYKETPGGIVWERQTAQGTESTPLTNFTARIVEDIIEDDGEQTERTMRLEAALRNRRLDVRIPAARFAGMNWPLEHLGSGAIIYPGMQIRDHARAAIQILSPERPERRVFTHLGWREIEGAWHYLHAAGAIHSGGLSTEVAVAPPPALSHYALPEPPEGERLRECIGCCLGFLDTAPEFVTFPLFCAIWAAPLFQNDFSIHLVGRTQAGKSELCTLVLRFWGRGFTSRDLPASWSSTANSLESLAFAAKDAILVIDDFVPSGGQSDVQRLHREAERILRAQGNRSGRQRMRSDTSIRAAKPPRGLIVSTGEDTPRGESLRARMLVLEIGAGQVDFARLTGCQKDSGDGLYAEAFAGYLRYLAGDLARIRDEASAAALKLRGEMYGGNQRRRTPEIVARLLTGFRLFLNYAQDVRALDAAGTQALEWRCRNALARAADEQAGHQAASEPAGQFLSLLKSAIASGQAHVANSDGAPPVNPAAWGWRANDSGLDSSLKPLGRRAGWVDDQGGLYLDPAAAYACANAMARDTGEMLAVAEKTLRRRLHERGLLKSVEEGRGTLVVRRQLEGAQRKVLHLDAGLITGETDIPDISDRCGGFTRQEPPDGGQELSVADSGTDISTDIGPGAIPEDYEPGQDLDVSNVSNVSWHSHTLELGIEI